MFGIEDANCRIRSPIIKKKYNINPLTLIKSGAYFITTRVLSLPLSSLDVGRGNIGGGGGGGGGKGIFPCPWSTSNIELLESLLLLFRISSFSFNFESVLETYFIV